MNQARTSDPGKPLRTARYPLGGPILRTLPLSGRQGAYGHNTNLTMACPLEGLVGLSRSAADWEERVVAVKGTELNQQAR